MANLSIRNVDKKTHELLRLRAAKHGVSMEEEARQILSRAVVINKPVGSVFQHYFGKKNGVELAPVKQEPHEPLDFDE